MRYRVAIPTIFTLANAVCGFMAILLLVAIEIDSTTGLPSNPENLVRASVLLFISWFFDMMDGLIARLFKATSEFGGQLDSLCDVVSFGVVPALLVLTTFVYLDALPLILAKIVGVVFLCAVLVRLARFNVEAKHDEKGHLYFKGLPSPAAALFLASIILWYQSLRDSGFLVGFAEEIAIAIPIVAIIASFLMVSNFRYADLPTHYFRRYKPLWHLLLLPICMLVFGIEPVLVLFFIGYVLSPVFNHWFK